MAAKRNVFVDEAEAGMEARQKLAVAEHNMSVMHHHLQEAK